MVSLIQYFICTRIVQSSVNLNVSVTISYLISSINYTSYPCFLNTKSRNFNRPFTVRLVFTRSYLSFASCPKYLISFVSYIFYLQCQTSWKSFNEWIHRKRLIVYPEFRGRPIHHCGYRWRRSRNEPSSAEAIGSHSWLAESTWRSTLLGYSDVPSQGYAGNTTQDHTRGTISPRAKTLPTHGSDYVTRTRHTT